MWYKLVKSSLGISFDLEKPEENQQEEEEIISPLFSNVETQLEDKRNNNSTNMLQREKGTGGMYMKNGEGTPQYSSGKGAPMFQDNLPSDRTLY